MIHKHLWIQAVSASDVSRTHSYKHVGYRSSWDKDHKHWEATLCDTKKNTTTIYKKKSLQWGNLFNL